MKVLQINSVCGIRSTGRICTDIADILTANGCDCKIAYGREAVPEQYQKYAVRIGNDFSVKLDAIKTRLFDNACFNSKTATKRFIKWAKEYDPDIIHLHNIHGYFINVKLLFDYLKSAGKPVVWTLHDCWSFTGHCAYFDFAGCDKWKNGCFDCPQVKEYPASVFIDNSKENYLRKSSIFCEVPNLTVVTPSIWLADLVKKSFLKDYAVKVINNGIDLNVFKPTKSDFKDKYGLQNKKIILGVAAVWDRRKGLSDFISLSKQLDDNYKIVLVGLSEEQIKLLPENIIGINKTNSALELAEIYTAADIFVNPTYEDNYPTTNLEAQACGTPVITYNTGGSTESLSDGCGAVIEKGDISSLFNCIVKNNLKTSNRVCFDKSLRCSEYIRLYEELMHENSALH